LRRWHQGPSTRQSSPHHQQGLNGGLSLPPVSGPGPTSQAAKAKIDQREELATTRPEWPFRFCAFQFAVRTRHPQRKFAAPKML
jgi:hypothetical protein